MNSLPVMYWLSGQFYWCLIWKFLTVKGWKMLKQYSLMNFCTDNDKKNGRFINSTNLFRHGLTLPCQATWASPRIWGSSARSPAPEPTLSWEIFPRQMLKKYPFPPRKWKHACGPFSVFEWGVGGGGGPESQIVWLSLILSRYRDEIEDGALLWSSMTILAIIQDSYKIWKIEQKKENNFLQIWAHLLWFIEMLLTEIF